MVDPVGPQEPPALLRSAYRKRYTKQRGSLLWTTGTPPQHRVPHNIKWTSFAPPGWTNFAPPLTLPIIHLVFANLKTWLIGIHHGVSHQHLQAYLNEFTFRFNRRFYPFNAFRSLLGIAGDTSAPTYAELYSGEWRHPTCSGHGR